MIDGGNASIYVENVDRAIEFYTKKVGLKLRTKVDENWAELDAGSGLILGLHPARPPETVSAGTAGSVNIELRVTVPMESAVATLTERGVLFGGPILNYENVRIASFSDPDGNTILLAEVLHG